MVGKIKTFPKPNYRIKLLAGNNVISVEAENYESEIFTAEIVNGRITLLNIIPNRRCCTIVKSNQMNYAKSKTREPSNQLSKLNGFQTKKKEELAPLANSTPLVTKQRSSCGNMFSGSMTGIASKESCLLTPENVRRAELALPNFSQSSILKLTKNGVRVARLYNNSDQVTPKKLGRVLSSLSYSGVLKSPNVSKLNSSYRIPGSPSMSSCTSKRTSEIDFSCINPEDRIARWQKVLTPIRTYTRISKNPIMVRRPVLVDSARKKPSKFKPTYLVNPTQGLNVTQQIEMKKRKIIIDKKISISPKTFKRQQKEPLATDTRKLAQPNPLSWLKPIKCFEKEGMSAFDLITNSNRSSCMAGKLKKQFRRGCVNKASSTCSKYKVLCIVPPLQEDKQIEELSRVLDGISKPVSRKHEVTFKKNLI